MINWLMQTTTDGSTYLQVIILLFLLFGVGIALYDTYKEWERLDEDRW